MDKQDENAIDDTAQPTIRMTYQIQLARRSQDRSVQIW